VIGLVLFTMTNYSIIINVVTIKRVNI